MREFTSPKKNISLEGERHGSFLTQLLICLMGKLTVSLRITLSLVYTKDVEF